MASATAVATSTSTTKSTPLDLKIAPSNFLPSQWASLLQQQLDLIPSSAEDEETPAVAIDEHVMEAPRRRAADPAAKELAQNIAQLMYSDMEPLGAIIRYEKDLVRLRRVVAENRKRTLEENQKRNELVNWEARVRKQGPWDPVADPISLAGAPSLPMPVEISDPDSLSPFFQHLALGGNDDKSSTAVGADGHNDAEPYYSVNTLEFEKGVVYSDHRMDLCKMALGPDNISALMESLKPNEFVTHFLLGNNIIGPHGARCIAQFLEEYPNRMETWYLAGNCIDSASFSTLVDGLVKSTSVTNIWLKRNPLGPSSADALFKLITQTAHLRTLDLDQTELGDAGVAELFTKLAEHDKEVALRHLYLNATGIGEKGAAAIGKFVSSPHCMLESIYAANNPMGNAGVAALASGLKQNKSLSRLGLASVGVSDDGAIALCQALQNHAKLTMLDVGQAYATEDLNARYNWITDASAPALASLIPTLPSLAYLDLSYTPMTHPSLTTLLTAVTSSPSLLFYHARPIAPQSRDALAIQAGQAHAAAAAAVRTHLARNVCRVHGADVSYDAFLAQHKRALVSDEESVRRIDSVYRNRAAGQARRGEGVLRKMWDEGDGTLERVKGAVGPVCTRIP